MTKEKEKKINQKENQEEEITKEQFREGRKDNQ